MAKKKHPADQSGRAFDDQALDGSVRAAIDVAITHALDAGVLDGRDQSVIDEWLDARSRLNAELQHATDIAGTWILLSTDAAPLPLTCYAVDRAAERDAVLRAIDTRGHAPHTGEDSSSELLDIPRHLRRGAD